MIEKIAVYSSKQIKRIKAVCPGIKIEKMLGNDGKATGYMTLKGSEKDWKLLADKKIWIRTMCWKTEEMEDFKAKARRPKSDVPTKGFKKFVEKMIHFDKIKKAGDTLILVENEPVSTSDEEVLIVKTVSPDAEKLVMEKAKILALAMNGYIKMIYPKNDWKKDCLNFKVIAKVKNSKWTLNVKTPFVPGPAKPSFDKYVNAVNTVQENRWEDSVYDGIGKNFNHDNGKRKYQDKTTLEKEFDNALNNKPFWKRKMDVEYKK